MPARRVWLIAAGLVGVMTVALAGVRGRHPPGAAPLIEAINAYRARTGHLPDISDPSLMTSLGFKLNVSYRPEFRPIDRVHYKLVYVDGFDCPYPTYDSRSNSWSDVCD